MNSLKLPLTLLLTISLLATSIAGQQKRSIPEKSAAKPPAAPAPAPATFETLLSADSYKIYAEVRGVGQLVKSSATTDVLDPILKLGGPDKEFVAFVNWLKLHADQLTTSRLLVAAWPTFKDVPSVVVAIEFASPEEAAKFESKLNDILPTMLPPVTPASTPEPRKEAQPKPSPTEKQATTEKPATQKLPATEKPGTEKPPAPVPAYYLQRSGALLIVSEKPLELKKLRPQGAKLISEDANFRVAYNRFASDPVFLYVDMNALEKEQEEQRKQYLEQQKKAEEARKAAAENAKTEKTETEEKPDTSTEFTVTEQVKNVAPGQPTPEPSPAEPSPEEAKELARAQMVSNAFSSLQYALFNAPTDWPNAVAFGFSPDNESFDLRALMIDSPGETSDPVPMFHGVRFGAPIAPASAAILPADSDLVLTLDLDFPQIYEFASTSPAPPLGVDAAVVNKEAYPQPDPPAAAVANLETALKINIKDELLPVLGSEIAVVLPMNELGLLPSSGVVQTQAKDDGKDPKPEPRSTFIVISLRDKEGARRLIPKILEGFAGKAATSLAQTERREDTEIVSYGGEFAYALIGDFFIFPTDVATVRHVVDSYLKGETLAADPHFRNSTRWQPRLVQGQVYLSPSLMEQYKTWANSSGARISDEARAFIGHLGSNSQPITYSLSNDGMGAFHELHVPKGLIQLAVANIASTENPPDTVKNERAAMSVLWNISNAEREHKEKNPTSYASMEELISSGTLKKASIDASGYKFEMRLTAQEFEVTAVPVEYGKSGKMSFFMDQTGMIRGGDHNGAPASASDQPAMYN